MRMIDLIVCKRDGGELSSTQINWFIDRYTVGEIPDYQVSALLMAIYIRGMNRRETLDLTLAMVQSGEQLVWHDVAPFVVDKHSSGGVGDKTTLVVQPLVAACGVPVGKMSGRGLGASGGTLDKMESFPGWSSDLTVAQFKHQLQDIGLVLAGQTAVLAPADGKLYALRDVTGTIANISLIAASIMSKKLAGGADGIVLDVKVGSGAFMSDVVEATKLAQLMVDIGRSAGRQTTAVLSDMNQPLGWAVGNALEVKEAIQTLRQAGPPDFEAHCFTIASHMLVLAGRAATIEEGRALARAARNDGRAFTKFKDMVVAQGGDVHDVEQPEQLAHAHYVEDVLAPRTGFIAAMNTAAIGWVCVHLGGGRLIKSDTIDHAVGLILPVKVGDYVESGAVIGTIHANSIEQLAQARIDLLAAISWSDAAVEPHPHFHGEIQS